MRTKHDYYGKYSRIVNTSGLHKRSSRQTVQTHDQTASSEAV